ncbi:hypothetical protein DP113_10515 [Brasilonema octagenarum UFV-E1]|jgi:hypothetical protein|uniref:Uncharacterized protein n=1 Tax=Brasilonema sennae CENA114 TaxID=415709 RepID=A0A856MAN4_9CYAN|nr:hypothetical protein DP114_10570 [Brasilonema sennae CENA114]QDL14643.1 hypothetical protein DP113_10515 [Brasilonema octagenarum UFV-E1]
MSINKVDLRFFEEELSCQNAELRITSALGFRPHRIEDNALILRRQTLPQYWLPYRRWGFEPKDFRSQNSIIYAWFFLLILIPEF